jgi:hypothetical protein
MSPSSRPFLSRIGRPRLPASVRRLASEIGTRWVGDFEAELAAAEAKEKAAQENWLSPRWPGMWADLLKYRCVTWEGELTEDMFWDLYYESSERIRNGTLDRPVKRSMNWPERLRPLLKRAGPLRPLYTYLRDRWRLWEPGILYACGKLARSIRKSVTRPPVALLLCGVLALLAPPVRARPRELALPALGVCMRVYGPLQLLHLKAALGIGLGFVLRRTLWFAETREAFPLLMTDYLIIRCLGNLGEWLVRASATVDVAMHADAISLAVPSPAALGMPVPALGSSLQGVLGGALSLAGLPPGAHVFVAFAAAAAILREVLCLNSLWWWQDLTSIAHDWTGNRFGWLGKLARAWLQAAAVLSLFGLVTASCRIVALFSPPFAGAVQAVAPALAPAAGGLGVPAWRAELMTRVCPHLCSEERALLSCAAFTFSAFVLLFPLWYFAIVDPLDLPWGRRRLFQASEKGHKSARTLGTALLGYLRLRPFERNYEDTRAVKQGKRYHGMLTKIDPSVKPEFTLFTLYEEEEERYQASLPNLTPEEIERYERRYNRDLWITPEQIKRVRRKIERERLNPQRAKRAPGANDAAFLKAMATGESVPIMRRRDFNGTEAERLNVILVDDDDDDEGNGDGSGEGELQRKVGVPKLPLSKAQLSYQQAVKAGCEDEAQREESASFVQDELQRRAKLFFAEPDD